MDPNDNAGTGNKPPDQGGNNTLVVILIIAMVAAVIAIVALAFALITRDTASEESETLPTAIVVTATPTQPVELVPTREPPISIPNPDPGDPSATVIARDGANIRLGPGTDYPSLGVAPQGASGEVIGISADSQWWAVLVPGTPNRTGWVFGELVEVENVQNVPVIPVPPPPATPTPTTIPAPDVVFTASRTDITASETSLLSWSVENVQAVFLYPVGADWPNYPTTGQGALEVQPFITTTYQLRVIKRDGATDLYNVEIVVRNGLSSGDWRMQSYANEQGALVIALPDTAVTARFNSSGTVAGSGGCNEYSGGYQAYDEVLRIGNLNATQTSCDADIIDQEQAFFSAMRSSAKMSIFGNQLTVRNSQGAIVLSFIRSAT